VTPHALQWFTHAVVIVIGFVAAVGALLTATAGWAVVRGRRRSRVEIARGPRSTALPASVLIVDRGNDPDVADCLQTLAALDYPAFEIIVVSDGPIGAPLARAMARVDAEPVDVIYRPVIPTARVTACYRASAAPNLVILEKSRTTTADALNAGINAARSPYVCLVAPNTRLDRTALARLMAPVAADPDGVVAVTGIGRVMSGGEERDGEVAVLGRTRRGAVVAAVLDGARATFHAIGLGSIVGLVSPPSACLLLQKHALLRVGGFVTGRGEEPIEALLRIRRALATERLPRRTVFVPTTVSWTAAPHTFGGLAARHRQRCHAVLDGLVPSARGVMRPAGWALLAGAWEFLAPFLEIGGAMWVTAMFQWGVAVFPSLVVVWLCVLTARTAESCAAILVQDLTLQRYPRWRDVGWLCATAFLEPFVLRPLAAWWTCQAVWRYRWSADRPRIAPTPAVTEARRAA
jgi:hypothetical protein